MSRSSWIVLLAACFFAARIIWQARRNRTHERHTLFWLGICVAAGVLAIWRPGIETVAQAMGIVYAPSALFILGMTALLYLVYSLSLEVSAQREQLRRLTQELALLDAEVSSRPVSVEARERPSAVHRTE